MYKIASLSVVTGWDLCLFKTQMKPQVHYQLIVLTEPVFIKSKDCESSTDDLNEYFRVAVSGLTVKQEFKCCDCSENFRIQRDLMTHRRAIHKEKIKICSNFAARTHCTFRSEIWPISHFNLIWPTSFRPLKISQNYYF